MPRASQSPTSQYRAKARAVLERLDGRRVTAAAAVLRAVPEAKTEQRERMVRHDRVGFAIRRSDRVASAG